MNKECYLARLQDAAWDADLHGFHHTARALYALASREMQVSLHSQTGSHHRPTSAQLFSDKN